MVHNSNLFTSEQLKCLILNIVQQEKNMEDFSRKKYEEQREKETATWRWKQQQLKNTNDMREMTIKEIQQERENIILNNLFQVMTTDEKEIDAMSGQR